MVEVIAHDVVYKNEHVSLILANDVTEKLKAEAELILQHTMHQKLVTENSIRVQEREREEIAKELHDNINQILASTKLYIELAIEGSGNDRPQLLFKSLDNVNLAIAEIRQLSQALVAPSLGDISLEQAIYDLIRNVTIASPLKLELKNYQYKEKHLDKDLALMFYRIIQEQVNNILKHSQATIATIQLGSRPSDLVLTIEDNGIGFDTNRVSGGIGLRNITNRAEFYNGTVEVTSSPGNGCNLKITIPTG